MTRSIRSCLLWVHACLVDSALLFEELTVGKLNDAGRQRFHEEQMLAAELVKIPREIIPPTVPALRAYMADVIDRGELLVTDSARKVAELFYHPPAEAEWRPVLKGVSRLAFATLPAPLREEFGITARSREARRHGGDVRRDAAGTAAPSSEGPLHRAVPGVATAPEGIEPHA